MAVNPRARCTIGVYYATTRSCARARCEDCGTITWTWTLGSTTKIGRCPVKFNCGKSGCSDEHHRHALAGAASGNGGCRERDVEQDQQRQHDEEDQLPVRPSVVPLATPFCLARVQHLVRITGEPMSAGADSHGTRQGVDRVGATHVRRAAASQRMMPGAGRRISPATMTGRRRS